MGLVTRESRPAWVNARQVKAKLADAQVKVNQTEAEGAGGSEASGRPCCPQPLTGAGPCRYGLAR